MHVDNFCNADIYLKGEESLDSLSLRPVLVDAKMLSTLSSYGGWVHAVRLTLFIGLGAFVCHYLSIPLLTGWIFPWILYSQIPYEGDKSQPYN